jgi:hypothetical protein
MLRVIQDLLGRGRRPGGGPRYEVWASAAAGRPFYCEAGGLAKPAALAAAERVRRGRPRGEVVVLDETGAPVAD